MAHLQGAGEDQSAPARHRGDDGAADYHGAGEYHLAENQLFTDYERELFTNVVDDWRRRKARRSNCWWCRAVDPFDAIVQTAAKLKASRVVTGRLAAHGSDGSGAAHRTGLGESAGAAASVFARSDSPGGHRSSSIWARIRRDSGRKIVDRLHDLWLKLTENDFDAKLHHRDVVGVALQRLKGSGKSERHGEAVAIRFMLIYLGRTCLLSMGPAAIPTGTAFGRVAYALAVSARPVAAARLTASRREAAPADEPSAYDVGVTGSVSEAPCGVRRCPAHRPPGP